MNATMGFSKLPNEIICTVLEASMPFDFENFVLVNKHVYSVAGSVLAKHNSRRKKYRRLAFVIPDHTRFEDLTLPPAGSGALQALSDIAKEPVLASYVVSLDLGNEDCLKGARSREEYSVAVKEHFDANPLLRSLVNKSEHLAAIGRDDAGLCDRWYQRIVHPEHVDDDGPYEEALLISLLPNLEELRLSSSWYEDIIEPEASYNQDDISETQRSVSKFLRLLVSRANYPTLKDQPLGKLRVLHPTYTSGSQFGIDLINFTPFLALQSLREAHIFDGTYEPGGEEEDRHRPERYPQMGEHLEKLTLDEGNISAEGASLFFKSMKSLKDPTLSYSMQDEVGYGWEIDAFVQNLGKAVGSTLETLSLKAGGYYDDFTADERLGSAISEFAVLQHLTLDCQLVQGASAHKYAEDEIPPQLVEILPSSLRSLTLLAHGIVPIVGFLEGLLGEFEEKRKERLPKLEKAELVMVVRLNPGETADSKPYVGPTRKLLERAGIEFEIVENHLGHPINFGELLGGGGNDEEEDEDPEDDDHEGDDDNEEEDME